MAAAAAYCLVLGLVVRPFLAERLARGQGRLRGRRWPALVLVLGGLAVSAAISEALGIHFVFGSFVFGAALPRQAASDLFEEIRLVIGPPARTTMPIFFVIPGLSLDLGAIGGSRAPGARRRARRGVRREVPRRVRLRDHVQHAPGERPPRSGS